jgi:sugar phosphate isomerase/epimerase
VIAAQLWTVREFTKTPAEFAEALKKVRGIGYRAVQLSGHGPIEAKELRKILKEADLICCGTHESTERFTGQFDQLVADHKLWRCKFTGVGGFFKSPIVAQDFIDFARQFDAIGAKLREQGLTFVYHNHHHEFGRYDGRLALDLLMENSSGQNVTFEIDTHWVARGGGDPAAWILKCAARGPMPLLHLKDFAVSTADKSPMFAEVGEGNLNWPAILKAAKKAKVRWYLVEQDKCERDPFESLKISYDNLVKWGLK